MKIRKLRMTLPKNISPARIPLHLSNRANVHLRSGLLGFALVSTGAAQAQSLVSGERARHLYETLSSTVTQYGASDYSFVVFTKESEWAKCTAYSVGEPISDTGGPGKHATYQCKMQNLTAKKRLDKLSGETTIVR